MIFFWRRQTFRYSINRLLSMHTNIPQLHFERNQKKRTEIICSFLQFYKVLIRVRSHTSLSYHVSTLHQWKLWWKSLHLSINIKERNSSAKAILYAVAIIPLILAKLNVSNFSQNGSPQTANRKLMSRRTVIINFFQ